MLTVSRVCVAVILHIILTLSASQKTFPSNFETSCTEQQQSNSIISCDDNGEFSSLQCEEGYCWCVNPEDGTRLNTHSVPIEKVSNDTCEDVDKCPSVLCDLFCVNGFVEDANGCEICECRENTCEDTNLENIAKRCGGKRCILYDSQTNCAKCRDDCGGNDSDNETSTCDQCLPDQDCVREGYGYVSCKDKISNGDTCKRPTEIEADDNGSFGDRDDNNEEKDESPASNMDKRDADRDEERELENVADGVGLTSAPPEVRQLISSDEEDREDIDAKRARRQTVAGASARYAVKRIDTVEAECMDGHYCEKATDLRNGRCTPNNSPCTGNNDVDRDQCDGNGYYKPRYCLRLSSTSEQVLCACYHPINGSLVPDSRVVAPADKEDLESTRIMPVDEPAESVPVVDRKPICKDRVYPSCTITRSNKTIEISHGRTYVDHCHCRYCQCYYGKLYCGSDQNVCDRGCQFTPCMLRGRTVRHGQTVKVNCNKCSCAYGNLFCTERACEDVDNDEGSADDTNDEDGEERECDKCRTYPVRKVCGPNGVTYPNKCFAVMCAGISSVELIDGPCQRVDPCDLYPCRKGERCINKGEAACLQRGGCPDQLRVCVNISEVVCSYLSDAANSDASDDDVVDRDDADDDASDRDDGDRDSTDGDDEDRTGDENELGSGDVVAGDTTVCGTDHRTYRSVCHLLQNTVNEQVLHAGKCNGSHCSGGPVCSNDGTTYESICILVSRSANSRFDYRGRCIDDENGDEERSYDDLCAAVERQNRCPYTNENCDYLVRPSTGCCPVCGGVVTVAVDRVSLGEAAKLDELLETLDDLGVNVAEDIALDSIAERCTIYFYWTNKGSLEVTLLAKNSRNDAKFCYEQGTLIADTISDDMAIKSPSSQYMLTANSAAVLRQDGGVGPTVDGSDGVIQPNGASVVASLSILVTIAAVFSALIF